MKIKYKKFWILYDGREVEELIEKEYDISFTGRISTGFCSDGIGGTNGYNIMIPVNEDIQEYRYKLILDLINRQNCAIRRANEEITKLVAKL